MNVDTVSYKNILISLAVFNVIVSLLMLLWPDLLARINTVMKKWFSTEHIEKALNKSRDIDNSILGVRKILGIISFIFSIIIVYVCTKL